MLRFGPHTDEKSKLRSKRKDNLYLSIFEQICRAKTQIHKYKHSPLMRKASREAKGGRSKDTSTFLERASDPGGTSSGPTRICKLSRTSRVQNCPDIAILKIEEKIVKCRVVLSLPNF